MGLSSDREELAGVLDAIDDVNGFAYRPNVMNAGDAWPMIDRLTEPEGRTFQAVWRVVVILPADERKASDWFDDHHVPITDDLSEWGFVDEVQPALVDTEAGVRSAMLFTVRREAT